MVDPQPPSEPLTLRAVLRAIFMPPEEAQEFHLPDGVNMYAFRRRLQPADDDEYSVDLSNLEPASVDYILPDPQSYKADRRNALVLGGGTLVTTLIALLAQSTLKGSEAGSSAFLLVCLVWILWIALLLFVYTVPDDVLLKRGPIVTGTLGWPLVDPFDNLNSLYLRVIMGISGLSLCVLTYFLTADNLFRPAGVATWILSILFWLLALADRDVSTLIVDWQTAIPQVPTRLMQSMKSRWVSISILVLIMAVAVFFRVYRLDAVPYQMTSDHVEKLLDSYDVSNGIYHVFFTRNGGREAIQFYLVPLAAWLFSPGMSFMTLKIVSVLEGLALIPLMLVLGREVIDTETGLFAAALVSVSWWHTALSRLSLRIVLTPLLFSLVLIMLVRAIRSGKRRAWLWAGFWMGIGVYAYQSMRMVPLVAIAAAVISAAGPIGRAVTEHIKNSPTAELRWQIANNAASRQLINLAACGIVALALFVPMLRVWHDYPDQLWNRVINRTTDNEVNIQGTATKVFLDNYGDALRMFNVAGDVAWISAIPGEPMLSIVGGALFLLGLAAWSVRITIRRDAVDSFWLVTGLIMLLPSALAIAFPIENPSATRASGTLPIVFLIAAWPLSLVRQKWTAAWGRIPGLVFSGLFIAALLIGTTAYNFEAYFTRYDAAYRAAALNPGPVADAVREVIGQDAPLDGVWLVGWPFWHDYRAIGIEAGDITYHNAVADTSVLQDYLMNFPDKFEPRPLVFIVNPLDEGTLNVLQEWYPAGDLQFHADPVAGKDFYLYVVN